MPNNAPDPDRNNILYQGYPSRGSAYTGLSKLRGANLQGQTSGPAGVRPRVVATVLDGFKDQIIMATYKYRQLKYTVDGSKDISLPIEPAVV